MIEPKDAASHGTILAAPCAGRVGRSPPASIWTTVSSRWWKKVTKTIDSRLRLDGIDRGVIEKLQKFMPIFEDNMPAIIADFYRSMASFPQTRVFFESSDVSVLKRKQITHWRNLMGSEFSRPYVRSAIRIGFVHHKIGLPLYLYLAGYNRILCELTRLAIMHESGALSSSETVAALIKAVSLDMDIGAISCYFLCMPQEEYGDSCLTARCLQRQSPGRRCFHGGRAGDSQTFRRTSRSVQ